MDKGKLEHFLSDFQGAESDYPFGPEALVFKVMGKMFALVSQGDDSTRVTLKCIPEDGAMLVGQYDSVVPGYYMNKKHWITISLTGDFPEEMVEDLARQSYLLVVNKLTKKEKEALEKLVHP